MLLASLSSETETLRVFKSKPGLCCTEVLCLQILADVSRIQSASPLRAFKIKLVLSTPKPASALLLSGSVYDSTQVQNHRDVFGAFLSLTPQMLQTNSPPAMSRKSALALFNPSAPAPVSTLIAFYVEHCDSLLT